MLIYLYYNYNKRWKVQFLMSSTVLSYMYFIGVIPFYVTFTPLLTLTHNWQNEDTRLDLDS